MCKREKKEQEKMLGKCSGHTSALLEGGGGGRIGNDNRIRVPGQCQVFS